MTVKIIPQDKMHLVEAFHSAQEAERKLSASIELLRVGGASISGEMLEQSIAATRRTLEALIAIQNLP